MLFSKGDEERGEGEIGSRLFRYMQTLTEVDEFMPKPGCVVYPCQPHHVDGGVKWGFVECLRTRNRFLAPMPRLASQSESGVADEESGKATVHLLQVILGSLVTEGALTTRVKTSKSHEMVLLGDLASYDTASTLPGNSSFSLLRICSCGSESP